MSKNNNKTSEELQRIREWCIAIMNFIVTHFGNDNIVSSYFYVINSEYDRGNLSGMKRIYRDINDWAKGFPIKDLDNLNLLLKTQFGEDLTDKCRENLKKIRELIKKGKISNESEYRLVIERIEEISNLKNQQVEIETLNQLLLEYK